MALNFTWKDDSAVDTLARGHQDEQDDSAVDSLTREDQDEQDDSAVDSHARQDQDKQDDYVDLTLPFSNAARLCIYQETAMQ